MNGPVLPATAHTDISKNDRSITKSACRERSQVTSANQNEPDDCGTYYFASVKTHLLLP